MFSKLIFFFKRHFSAERLQVDPVFRATIIVLVVFGLIMLTSASSIVAYNTYHDAYYFLKHQLVSVIIGAGLFWLASKTDYRHLRKIALFFLIASVLLLLLVFIPGLGREINGSRSWVNLFGYSFQPAEFVKLALMIYLAALFEKKEDTPKRFKSFLVLYAALALLMLLQPDLGTLFILTLASFALYYIGGGSLKHILSLIAIAIIGLGILVMIPQGRYRLDRFRCLIDSSYSPQKACYQLNQSLLAIGSGGIFGRGLGESRQKFLYLPEVQNDFIFAIIAEETGLVFSVLLIGLFGLLFYRGYLITIHAPDSFGRNMGAGIIIWLMVQVILNIGGITSILPMTGVPLPLVSYGGTAMMAGLAGLGILASISKQANIPQRSRSI